VQALWQGDVSCKQLTHDSTFIGQAFVSSYDFLAKAPARATGGQTLFDEATLPGVPWSHFSTFCATEIVCARVVECSQCMGVGRRGCRAEFSNASVVILV
jgi:hypothetical protein